MVKRYDQGKVGMRPDAEGPWVDFIDYDVLAARLAGAEADIKAARDAVADRQCRIDALMWEYCPDEMTADQKATWARHQRAADSAPTGETDHAK